MKNIGMTVVMFLFVGVTTTMAQEKKEAQASSKTEMKAEHACKPGCTMACCSGKDGAKKSCTAEEKAKCAHSTDAKKEEHEGATPEE